MSAERVLGRALAGAVLAAVVVGLAEATLVSVERHLGFDGGLLFFALASYGLAGIAIGVGMGVVLGLASRAGGATAFAASGAATFAVLVTVIGRFRVFRDVFHETFDGAPLSPLMFQVASLGAALVLFAIAFVGLRVLAKQQPLAASPVVVTGVLLLSLVASHLGPRLLPARPAGHRTAAVGPSPKGPSTILIVVDTLRADHLSCYGSANATPAIDALARDGTRFAHTYSQASWTRPAIATILTSLYPSAHRAIHKSDALPDAVLTLPEVMQAAGFTTIGFANNINIAPLFGFGQGYDEYVFLEPDFFFGATESAAQLTIYNQLRLMQERYFAKKKWVQNYYQPAEVVTQHGLDWLTAHGGERPFFMFLHYMEPHDPYFIHPWNGEAFARVADPNPDPSRAAAMIAAYDGEIRYLDGELDRLFGGLKKLGLYEGTTIVLTADHGEEFHEHGGWWHGTTLYDEQITVPLIVKAPKGGAAGVVNDAMVSSLDIAPTIIATAGVAVPQQMMGKPLGLAADAPAPRDHSYSESDLEGNNLQSYRSGGWKVIDANRGNPRGLPERQLFQVSQDPHETKDLLATNGAEAEKLATNMSAVRTHALSVAVESTGTSIDAASEERLRALGYVH